ncbi:hypothetical protein D4R52_03445 [bacterium]|nr:MAG: hypothetical protein D4R52_03445 [bacterium]
MGTQNPSLTSTSNNPATPGQIRDIRNQTEAALENGKFLHAELLAVHKSGIYPEEYQQFMRQLAARLMTPAFDLAGALTLLGQANLVTHEQNSTTFGQPSPKGQIVACPNMAQIQECAAQNKAGKHNWFLTYASDLSLVDQHAILGTSQHPRFYPGVDWFLKPEQKAWAPSKPVAGFYLIDMIPRWNRTNWQQQGENITGLGVDYERADERVFSQAVLAYQKVMGKRLFDNVWHWGRILDSDGYRVCVGLVPVGLGVGYGPPSSGDSDDLFVCVARKSAHRALVA